MAETNTTENFQLPRKNEDNDNEGGTEMKNNEINVDNRSRFQKFIEGPAPAYSLVMIDFFGLGCIMPLLPFFCKDFENGGLWLGAIMTAQAGGVV